MSYEVTFDDGRKFTRHIDHIRKRYDTQTVGNAMSTTDTSSELTTDTRSNLTTDTHSDLTTDTRSDPTTDTPSDPTIDPTSDPSIDHQLKSTPSDTTPHCPTPLKSYPRRIHRPPDYYTPSDFRRKKL